VAGIRMENMSGKELKSVKELKRVNNAFVMEPNVLEEVNATLADIEMTGVTMTIPQSCECSYKGIIVQVIHRLEITIVAGRRSGDVTTYQIPLRVARFQ
jgi:hypothetical protein